MLLVVTAIVCIAFAIIGFVWGMGYAQYRFDETLIRNPLQIGDFVFVGGDPVTGEGAFRVMLSSYSVTLNAGVVATFETAPLTLMEMHPDGSTSSAELIDEVPPHPKSSFAAFVENKLGYVSDHGVRGGDRNAE